MAFATDILLRISTLVGGASLRAQARDLKMAMVEYYLAKGPLMGLGRPQNRNKNHHN